MTERVRRREREEEERGTIKPFHSQKYVDSVNERDVFGVEGGVVQGMPHTQESLLELAHLSTNADKHTCMNKNIHSTYA